MRLKLSTTIEADVWRLRLKRVRARQEDQGQFIRDLAQAANSEPPGAESLPWSARSVNRFITSERHPFR